MTTAVASHSQASEVHSYPDTPVNHHESHLQEAIEKAFQILDTDSEKMIKLLPKGITITVTFFEAVEDAWEQFVKDNNLADVLIESKDDFLYDTLDSGAGGRLFWDYKHSNK